MAGVEKSLLRVRSLAHEFQTHPSWKNIQFALLSGLEVRHVWGGVFSGNSSHRGLELEMEGMQEVEDAMCASCLHFVSALWVPSRVVGF